MHHRFDRALFVPVALAMLTATAPAAAQSVGVGPRLSFIRGDATSGTPSSSLFGGTLRFLSKHTTFELSMDIKTVYSADRMLRFRETPIQTTLLFYPARAAVAPYLLGGFGIYRQSMDAMDAAGEAVSGVRTQDTGFHLGGGIELRFGRHIGVYGDYRFRFVEFGPGDDDSEPIDLPLVPKGKLSHKGSMWTTGLSFYF